MQGRNPAMTLTEELQSKYARANQIWRFYSDSARQWRWERLAFDGKVLEHSPSGYKGYDDCLANACMQGYVLLPSLSTKTASSSRKTKRPYIRFSSK